MTFNEDKKNTIRNYERVENYYDIYYLDNKKYHYYTTDKSEEKNIQEKMIKQAEKRYKSCYNMYVSGYNIALTELFIGQLPIILLLGANITKFFIFCILLEMYLIYNYKYKLNKTLELEKYKTYLDNKKLFDNLTEKEIFLLEQEFLYKEKININTLDNYTNKEINKMIKVLKNNN